MKINSYGYISIKVTAPRKHHKVNRWIQLTANYNHLSIQRPSTF